MTCILREIQRHIYIYFTYSYIHIQFSCGVSVVHYHIVLLLQQIHSILATQSSLQTSYSFLPSCSGKRKMIGPNACLVPLWLQSHSYSESKIDFEYILTGRKYILLPFCHSIAKMETFDFLTIRKF